VSAALETGGLAVAEAAFAASRGLFEQVAADLTSPDAAALTHSGLEDLLAARMREVTRQLFQDHLDLRAVREQRAGQVVDAAGVERTRIERGRRRILATVFGKVTATGSPTGPPAPGICTWPTPR
jgi:hypothetical protein